MFNLLSIQGKAISAAFIAFSSLSANAALTSYNYDDVDLVYSSVSDVTWTKDANLLRSLFVSQGFNKTVNAIIAASPTITNTPSFYSPSGIYTLKARDFSVNGQTSWFGAMAFINYLNGLNYGGSNQWRLPTVASTTSGYNPPSNGTTTGDELTELYYQELGGKAYTPAEIIVYGLPNTTTFDNEQTESTYWSSTEYAPNSSEAWNFYAYRGFQSSGAKGIQSYVWAVSQGQISAVPEPEPFTLSIAGLALLGIKLRQRKQ